MKVMECVMSGISKEILKEVRRSSEFCLMISEISSCPSFPLRFLRSHLGNSLVMEPQASCLSLHLACHTVLTLFS